MRSDIFVSRKCVHIKLKKDVHAALRERLLKYNVTMQDLFSDFAEVMCKETGRSDKFIQSVANRKLKELIEGKDEKREVKELIIGNLDSEALYNLIENAEKKKNEE